MKKIFQTKKFYLLSAVAAIVLVIFVFQKTISFEPINTFLLKWNSRQSANKKISNVEKNFVYTLEKEYAATGSESEDVVISDIVHITSTNHKASFLEAKSADKSMRFVVSKDTIVAYPKFNYDKLGKLVGIGDTLPKAGEDTSIESGTTLLVSYFKSKINGTDPIPLLHVLILDNW